VTGCNSTNAGRSSLITAFVPVAVVVVVAPRILLVTAYELDGFTRQAI